MKRISIIVPCFNEQEVIQKTYERLRELSLPGYEKEILFVDDGSIDRTPEILKGFAARDPQVRVLLFVRDFGTSQPFPLASRIALDKCRHFGCRFTGSSRTDWRDAGKMGRGK